MNRRIAQLDSLRGLASFSVLLHHLYLVFPFWPVFLKLSPLRVMVNGHAPVILFFVLSGFVLSLPYWNGQQPSYGLFVLRRIFRIYIPYLISVITAVILAATLADGRDIPGIVAWQSGIRWRTLMEHVQLIYISDTQAFNNVIWSLMHEMRISLIFPLIVFAVARCSRNMLILLCLLLSAPFAAGAFFEWHSGLSSLFETMHYASLFILGAALAKHAGTLIGSYWKMKTYRKWLLLIVAFLLYAYSTVINSFFLRVGLPNNFVVSDYSAALASGCFIVLALGSVKLSGILLRQPLLWIGKISYSLYLYHILVLFSMMHLFDKTLPAAVIMIATIILSLIMAGLSWRFVETPSVSWGRNVMVSSFFAKSLPRLPDQETSRTG